MTLRSSVVITLSHSRQQSAMPQHTIQSQKTWTLNDSVRTHCVCSTETMLSPAKLHDAAINVNKQLIISSYILFSCFMVPDMKALSLCPLNHVNLTTQDSKVYDIINKIFSTHYHRSTRYHCMHVYYALWQAHTHTQCKQESGKYLLYRLRHRQLCLQISYWDYIGCYRNNYYTMLAIAIHTAGRINKPEDISTAGTCDWSRLLWRHKPHSHDQTLDGSNFH